MSIVTNKIANKVLDGIIGVNGVKRNYDSSSDERRCFQLTPENIKTYNNIFKYNGGILSDGKYKTIKNNATIFVRIPINISMLDQEYSYTDDPTIESLETRSKNKKSSLQVFVDGKKIPDCEVFMYPTKSNVDVFIPNTYIDPENGNYIIVERKKYDEHEYCHYYGKNVSTQVFSIKIDNKEDLSIFKEKNVQIYVNKELYNSSRYISVKDSYLYVELGSSIQDSEIEIIVDPYVMYFFAFSSISYGDEIVYEIPETYIDSIHGPISKFSCMFYLNGKRVSNVLIDQKGRLHFVWPSEKNIGGNISFYLSDKNKIVDTDVTLYGSDYYLYNMIGYNGVSNAIKSSISGFKYIDAGANKEISNLEIKFDFGKTTSKLSLPKDILVSKEHDDLKFKISNVEVSKEDYTIDYESNPIEITLLKPNKYISSGSSAYASISIRSWFDWNEVLNKNGDLFSRQKVKEIISTYNSGIDPSTKVANALVNRPYLMRTFLENYGHERYIYEIEYNSDVYVYVGLPSGVDVSSGKNYDISVNNKHISSSDVEIINKDITDVFKIEGKYFDLGTNEIEIEVFDNNPIEYKNFKSTDVKNYDGINILTIKGFFNQNRLGDVSSNLIILEKVNGELDENVKNFPTDYNVGYKLFEGYDVIYDKSCDSVIITFDSNGPENDFIVYNKNFSLLYSYTKPIDSSVADVLIPVYTGANENPIPYISRGKTFVYVGSDRLVEGIDYFIKDPTIESSVGGSFVIMKRTVLPGETVDIYYSNIKTTPIYNKTGYFKNNNYGLFYFSSLRYPFSLKYMNLYLNGQKLSEDDVDILSDKLIRVHSLPTQLYDLALESTFTVDISELDTYINQYKEDDFELYLAHLFRGVNYDREFELNEETTDVNEIYESFIDTVDSVGKIPNPVSREGIWIPSYNDDPKIIGPYNDGDSTLGNTINASIIVGNRYVVCADNGKVASCTINNDLCEWTNCYDDVNKQGIHSNGEQFDNEDITAVILYKGYIVFGTRKGHIVVYDQNTNVWYNKHSDFNMTKNIKWPENVSINGFLVNNETQSLYVYGDNGNVDSFDFESNEWNGSDGMNNVGISNIIGNIYTAFIIQRFGKQMLVVLGENGQAASCYVDYNTWIDSSGIRRNHESGLACPTVRSDGSYRSNSSIRSYSIFRSSKYVLFGDNGIISYFDPSTCTFYNKDNINNLCDDGTKTGFNNINSSININDKFIVTGCNNGYVSEYISEEQSWKSYDSGESITSDGGYMEGNDINTVQATYNSTNYIIFAGENGKVCSYNINVNEVPYRYDPYKSVFLKWYTTEGNAIIQSSWNIPENISKKFDMYKEDKDSGDICIKGGDSDIMTDIDMNDNETYPWNIDERKRFIANFIKGLPEGRYTMDEIIELYKNSEAVNMLYIEDIENLVLSSGDMLDVESDIDITKII